ncbi:ELWxxDGT repeat protein [Flavobacterium sp. 25HG05S-40]|uniref:ELWxxDGT repeat protein n=1 Tax=Flavobacterium sp. 25HG05S-40 TaxID=3458682 RepID=UPI004043FB3E
MNKKMYIAISCLLFQFVSSQEILQELGIINSSSQHCSPTFKVLNNIIFFDAGSGLTNGIEPWSCNPATGSTSLFQNINSGFNSSNPYFIATINSKLFFSADDGTHGLELWITDGTVAGTQLVKDINTGASAGMLNYNCQSSGPVFNDSKNYGVLNNKLIFEGFTNNGEQLWISDGTTTGTVLLKQIDPSSMFNGNINFIQNFTAAGNKLFFTALTNTALNRELWVTDGTPSGTFMTKDINLGNNSSQPQNLTPFNNKLYFTANDGTHGTELWSSDGTTNGTSIVSDINPGGLSSNPSGLFVVNDKLFFLANNGSVGNELWVHNSTTGITSLVKDTQLGASGILYMHNQTMLNSVLYFMTPDQLWRTDGTSSGTLLVKGNLSIDAATTKMVVFNNKLYFGSDYLLWSSDGTPAGTTSFPELPNTSFTSVQPFTDINGKLIIVPNLSNFGTINGRFWSCDSAENITLIDVGSMNSYGNLFKYNDALYFEGSNPNYKLFRYGLPLNLSIVTQTKKQFKIYPNPVKDLVTIQVEDHFFNNASITLSTIYGQTILKKENLYNNEIQIDVTEQLSGIYFITIENNGFKTTHKIIIE